MRGHDELRNLDDFAGAHCGIFSSWPVVFAKIFCGKLWAIVICMQ